MPFTRAHLALVHRRAGDTPLSSENPRIQLEGFSGVLPHPHLCQVTIQAQQGRSEGTPYPIGTLRLCSGAHRPAVSPPVLPWLHH